MIILAIDPGTSCGFATSAGPSGTWDLTPAKARAGKPGRPAKLAKRDGRVLVPAVEPIPPMDAEPDDQRLVNLWARLDSLVADGCTCGAEDACRVVLVHEAPLPHHASQRAAQLAFWWQAGLILWAYRLNVRRVEVTPLDLQRFALGRKATTGASDMLNAARQALGYAGSDEDEADALWLLEWARVHGPRSGWWSKGGKGSVANGNGHGSVSGPLPATRIPTNAATGTPGALEAKPENAADGSALPLFGAAS